MIPYLFAGVLVASALIGNFLPNMIGRTREEVQTWLMIALIPFFIFTYLKSRPEKEALPAPEPEPQPEPQQKRSKRR